MADRRIVISEDPETGESVLKHEGFSNDHEALGWMQTHADMNQLKSQLHTRIQVKINAKKAEKAEKAKKAESEKSEG